MYTNHVIQLLFPIPVMVTIYTYAFVQFNQIIIAQQNRVAGTISNSLHFIHVQYQLMNAPLSYAHDI